MSIPKRIGIVGTRFTALHGTVWERELERFVSTLAAEVQLVTNGAPGTDQTVARLAMERGIPVTVLFPAGIYAGDPRFFVHQNDALLDQVDELHAFWDGQSAGTHHAIVAARYRGIPHHVHLVHSQEWQHVR